MEYRKMEVETEDTEDKAILKTKANIYKNKKLFKKTGFSIKEVLTRSNIDLMKKAIDKYGFSNVWSQNGKFYALANNARILIKCPNDCN
ncbi:hypothetical protein NQ315_002766 [Exocentrus adspersus]|uniref:Uncharacterized protein n=1 Tax=Exocentrus adspersus TaxID=1586481 RepID=A0AAV8VK04_9CUCU|nr:hypothetical protein NQ315_002766 [Exocentrus adspersus]